MAALIVAVSTLRLWPFVQGRMPAVGDHPVHLHKLWFLWERLLPRGRVSGWSSYWFLGEPVGDLYPPGQDLWTAAFRALTLGQLSWERTYGLALVGFYALSAWCLYDLGRRFFGRGAGLVAAALWLLDPGAWEQGGWYYHVFFGVWGQGLAQALLLPALWWTVSWLEDGGRARLGMAGLLLGLSVLCHPMNLLLIGIFGVALILGYRVRDRARLLRLALVPGLGLLVSASFLLPFLARTAYARNIGGAGLSAEELISDLSQGALLTGLTPGTSLLCLLGLAALLRGGDRMGRTLAISLGALMLLRTEWVSSLPFKELPWLDLSNLMFRRFSVPARTLSFLLAGVGAATAARAMWRWRGAAAPGAAGLLALALFGHGLVSWVDRAVQDRNDLPMLEQGAFFDSYKSWLSWSTETRARTTDFYRVALLLGQHDHRLMASTLLNRTPILKIGYTPAHLARLSPDRPSSGLFRAASVRWLVSDHPLDNPKARKEADWGALSLWEFTDWRPQRYTLDGRGFVEQLRFEDERVALRLSGTDLDSRLILHVADFPRWRAQQGGVELPITRVPLWEGGEEIGMSVPVHDGVLRFDYVRRPVDQLAIALSLLGFGLAGWLIYGPRRRPSAAAPAEG